MDFTTQRLMVAAGSGGSGNVSLLRTWFYVSNINTTIDASSTLPGMTWFVCMFKYGTGGGASVPAPPTIDGIPLTLRISDTTYYADDGSAAAIYAAPISTGTASSVFAFQPILGGYNNSHTGLYKVVGVDPLATISTYTVRKVSSFVGGNGANSCSFVVASSAKNGSQTNPNPPMDSDLMFNSLGADRFTGGVNLTYSYPIVNQLTCFMSLPYSVAPVGP